MTENSPGDSRRQQVLERKILDFIERHNTISLATCADDNPHAASLFYVNIGFDLYFVSSPRSRHACELSKNPKVAGTINPDYSNWLEIKGVQLEGEAVCIGGLMKNAKIVSAYIKKFPNVADFFLAPHKLGAAVARKVAGVRFYRIVPSRLYFIDNAAGFGQGEELELLSVQK